MFTAVVLLSLGAIILVLALPIDLERAIFHPREPGSLEVAGPPDATITRGDHWIMEDGATLRYRLHGSEWAARDSRGTLAVVSASCTVNGETRELAWDPYGRFERPAAEWLLPEGEYAVDCTARLETGEEARTSATVLFDPGAPPNQLPLVLRSPGDATVEGVGPTVLYSVGLDEWVVIDDHDEALVDCKIDGRHATIGEEPAVWDLHAGTHRAVCYARDQVGATMVEHEVAVVAGVAVPAEADAGAGLFADAADEAKARRLAAMLGAGELGEAEYARALAYLQASGVANFDAGGGAARGGAGIDPGIHAAWAAGEVTNEEYRAHLERAAAGGYFEGLAG